MNPFGSPVVTAKVRSYCRCMEHLANREGLGAMGLRSKRPNSVAKQILCYALSREACVHNNSL
jgi:hypothetical protein